MLLLASVISEFLPELDSPAVPCPCLSDPRVLDLPDFDPLVHQVMAKAIGASETTSGEMMRLVNLIRWNGYLLFPSQAERDAQPKCRNPWFVEAVPDPEFQNSTDFAYEVSRHGLMENPIERAKRLGTFGQVDRTRQYEGPERARPEALLHAVNALGNNQRKLMSEKDRMQKQLMNLKLRNSIVTAAVTAALVRGPELLRFALHLLR